MLNFILQNYQCPGDILMLTSAVRDFKKWYPHVNIDVRTSCDSLFENNPYITPLKAHESNLIRMEYPIVHQSNQNKHSHFLHGFISYLNESLQLQIKLTEFKPDIHLTQKEKENKLELEPDGAFIVFASGGKDDFPAKNLWPAYWYEIIESFPGTKFVQVGASEHDHPQIPLPNVINMIGKTNLRELASIIYRSSGVVCIITCLMHMAAAFDKQCVAICGGREPWWWEKYPGHIFMHTIGELNCCETGGCWKDNCENHNMGRQKCMEMIKPDVIKAVGDMIDKI